MESQDPTAPIFTDRPAGEEGEGEAQSRQLSRLVFGITSIGFLVFLVVGSVEARIWRFGRLNFEDRTVREVWAYLGDHLPDMPGQPVITALFWISVAVMVAGTVLGLWLILGGEDEDAVSRGDVTPASATKATHA